MRMNWRIRSKPHHAGNDFEWTHIRELFELCDEVQMKSLASYEPMEIGARIEMTFHPKMGTWPS